MPWRKTRCRRKLSGGPFQEVAWGDARLLPKSVGESLLTNNSKLGSAQPAPVYANKQADWKPHETLTTGFLADLSGAGPPTFLRLV